MENIDKYHTFRVSGSEKSGFTIHLDANGDMIPDGEWKKGFDERLSAVSTQDFSFETVCKQMDIINKALYGV